MGCGACFPRSKRNCHWKLRKMISQNLCRCLREICSRIPSNLQSPHYIPRASVSHNGAILSSHLSNSSNAHGQLRPCIRVQLTRHYIRVTCSSGNKYLSRDWLLPASHDLCMFHHHQGLRNCRRNARENFHSVEILEFYSLIKRQNFLCYTSKMMIPKSAEEKNGRIICLVTILDSIETCAIQWQTIVERLMN